MSRSTLPSGRRRLDQQLCFAITLGSVCPSEVKHVASSGSAELRSDLPDDQAISGKLTDQKGPDCSVAAVVKAFVALIMRCSLSLLNCILLLRISKRLNGHQDLCSTAKIWDDGTRDGKAISSTEFCHLKRGSGAPFDKRHHIINFTWNDPTRIIRLMNVS